MENRSMERNTSETQLLWTDKKNTFFGKPWSFTRYLLYSDRLLIKYGVLTRRQEELRLYRVKDISLRQTLLQRIFHLGTLTIASTDVSASRFLIINVKDPERVARLLSDSAEKERIAKGLTALECLDTFR